MVFIIGRLCPLPETQTKLCPTLETLRSLNNVLPEACFGRETFHEYFDARGPSFILNINVGAHSVGNVRLVHILALSSSEKSRCRTVSLSGVPRL